jgi:MGT family glycosyltransferase
MNHIPGIYPCLLGTIIAGLREEPINLIVTVGRDCDPAALGPQPATVHVERYIPQTLLFPHCDLALSHGGHNTVLAAVAAGLPQVLIPIVADQPDNARRSAQLGLGRVIGLTDVTPEAVREAVWAVLGDPQYRTHARRLRAEMEALPGMEHGVRLIEHLVAARQPLLAREVA